MPSTELFERYTRTHQKVTAPLSFEAFATEVGALATSIPFERDVREAWPLFRQSRVEYERYALELSAYIGLDIPASSWLRPVETVESPTPSLSSRR